MINIAVDVMGGDFCPDCNLDGVLDALTIEKEVKVLLVGPEQMISEKISAWDEEIKSRVEIVDAQEVITTDESPIFAVRRKKNSSLVVAGKLVKEGKADALISAGSTGAILGVGQLVVGRLKGVDRPPLASMIPTKKGYSLFLDMGANVDANSEWLVQFARMGSIYMQKIGGIASPVVKLVNLGTEDEKGNALTKETNQLLKELSDINYQGYIESRDVIMGEADVIVADAFTGNAILKTMEGTVDFVVSVLKDVLKSTVLTKIAALFIMKPLKAKIKSFSAKEHGGAMLLGLNGLVVKCHGNATRTDIKFAVLKSAQFVREDVCSIMREAFAEKQV